MTLQSRSNFHSWLDLDQVDLRTAISCCKEVSHLVELQARNWSIGNSDFLAVSRKAKVPEFDHSIITCWGYLFPLRSKTYALPATFMRFDSSNDFTRRHIVFLNYGYDHCAKSVSICLSLACDRNWLFWLLVWIELTTIGKELSFHLLKLNLLLLESFLFNLETAEFVDLIIVIHLLLVHEYRLLLFNFHDLCQEDLIFVLRLYQILLHVV